MHFFSFEGRDWSFDDYTLDEMSEIEDRLDLVWGDLRPRGSAKHALTLITVYLRRTMSEDDTAKVVSGLTVADLKKGVTYSEDDDLPVAWSDGLPTEGAPATTGSSGAPTASDGPPASPEPSLSAT